jgi:hypothetical protein
VRQKVNEIVTGGPAAILAANENTSTISIVTAQDDDPVEKFKKYLLIAWRPRANAKFTAATH